MVAKLINNINVIPMSKYDYHKMIKKVTYLTDKKVFGYYFPDLHIWILDDIFEKVFVIDEE